MSPAIATLLADLADEPLVDCLRARGWLVLKVSPNGWETPKQFNRRHGRHKTWLSLHIYRGSPVPEFEAEYGKTGRLLRLRSNPALEEFVAKAV